MAEKKKAMPRGKPFPKGHKLGGRPTLPEEIKNITRETKPQIIAAYWKIANLTPDQAKDYQPANLIEIGVMKTVKEFGKTGKTDQIRHIWAECHGKPTESVNINGDIKSEMTVTVTVNGK